MDFFKTITKTFEKIIPTFLFENNVVGKIKAMSIQISLDVEGESEKSLSKFLHKNLCT